MLQDIIPLHYTQKYNSIYDSSISLAEEKYLYYITLD